LKKLTKLKTLSRFTCQNNCLLEYFPLGVSGKVRVLKQLKDGNATLKSPKHQLFSNTYLFNISCKTYTNVSTFRWLYAVHIHQSKINIDPVKTRHDQSCVFVIFFILTQKLPARLRLAVCLIIINLFFWPILTELNFAQVNEEHARTRSTETLILCDNKESLSALTTYGCVQIVCVCPYSLNTTIAFCLVNECSNIAECVSLITRHVTRIRILPGFAQFVDWRPNLQ